VFWQLAAGKKSGRRCPVTCEQSAGLNTRAVWDNEYRLKLADLPISQVCPRLHLSIMGSDNGGADVRL
jgi:hypothetical protein